jgi:hypothetical protein
MNRLLSCSVAMSTISCLVSLVAVLHNCSMASAQTVVIDQTDRGWYDDLGRHDQKNDGYYVGDHRIFGCGQYCSADTRNFFVFDLAGVAQPIASAKLELSVPNQGYQSDDPSENYELHDVVTPISTLVGGTGGVAAHADLGSGVVYGSRTMSAADDDTVVEITLNSAAIAALNENHGLFGIGGSITTLDDLTNNELQFAFTGSNIPVDITQLRLTLVPEPSTISLLAIGAISLLGYRKAKSHG